MSKTEQELISLCQAGNRDAFNELVELYQNKVINIAYGILSDYEDASDAAQEAFIKAYRSIGKFQGRSSFSTWIYRITVNVCTDFIRKKSKQQTLSINAKMGDDGNEFDIKDTSHTPDEKAEIIETQQEVRKAINSLNQDYKTVIILYDIEGLSYQQISDMLDCPIGTVKSRLSRARNELKKYFRDKRELFFDNSV